MRAENWGVLVWCIWEVSAHCQIESRWNRWSNGVVMVWSGGLVGESWPEQFPADLWDA
jgi:hypothetical protein